MTSTNLSEASAWKGVWTALITPLKKSSDGLVLDTESLAQLIESQIDAGLHGLVIAGSTGEGSLLSDATYRDLLKESKRIVGKRLRLVAGLGIGGTENCLKNLKFVQEMDFDGALASPPAYVKAPQRGLVEHYLRLGEEGLPICVYEVAGRAASSIDVSTLAEICNSKHKGARAIVATKDASAKMERALETSRLLGDRIALLSGDDFTWAPFIACGGVGLISVVSHLTPRSLLKIWVDSVNGESGFGYRRAKSHHAAD